MDSSLVQQMIEQHPFLNRFRALLTFFEDLAVRNAKGVATVCDALARPLQRYKGQRVVVLQDISLLSASQEDEK
jgi:hypothetical protein